ncbi:hypothetical protein PHYPO_G00151040 [Pangasianodon hypophthalmus]|uniref:Small integral membrane protein 11 n=1 Tax=Pangasianodon hypophthalmus TaxID=310915 RepID=A0A5N5K0P7_PANHP|nr:hypothetical protein PHYPO_G00151040 [Pangasianodon hypophthalmus]
MQRTKMINWRALDNVPLLFYILAAKTLLLCLAFAGAKLYQQKKAQAALKQQESRINKRCTATPSHRSIGAIDKSADSATGGAVSFVYLELINVACYLFILHSYLLLCEACL